MARIRVEANTPEEISAFIAGITYVNDSSIEIIDINDDWVILEDYDAKEDDFINLSGGE